MPTQTLGNQPTPHRRVASASGDGRLEAPTPRWTDKRSVATTISRHLRNARVRLDELIAECACPEWLGFGGELEDRERVAAWRENKGKARFASARGNDRLDGC